MTLGRKRVRERGQEKKKGLRGEKELERDETKKDSILKGEKLECAKISLYDLCFRVRERTGGEIEKGKKRERN